MNLLKLSRYWQTRRQFAMSLLMCCCVLGFVPIGYGQIDNVSQLISQLKDRNPQIRRQAAEALGEAKDLRAV